MRKGRQMSNLAMLFSMDRQWHTYSELTSSQIKGLCEVSVRGFLIELTTSEHHQSLISQSHSLHFLCPLCTLGDWDMRVTFVCNEAMRSLKASPRWEDRRNWDVHPFPSLPWWHPVGLNLEAFIPTTSSSMLSPPSSPWNQNYGSLNIISTYNAAVPRLKPLPHSERLPIPSLVSWL